MDLVSGRLELRGACSSLQNDQGPDMWAVAIGPFNSLVARKRGGKCCEMATERLHWATCRVVLSGQWFALREHVLVHMPRHESGARALIASTHAPSTPREGPYWDKLRWKKSCLCWR